VNESRLADTTRYPPERFSAYYRLWQPVEMLPWANAVATRRSRKGDSGAAFFVAADGWTWPRGSSPLGSSLVFEPAKDRRDRSGFPEVQRHSPV
jgi:hypothetical protein